MGGGRVDSALFLSLVIVAAMRLRARARFLPSSSRILLAIFLAIPRIGLSDYPRGSTSSPRGVPREKEARFPATNAMALVILGLLEKRQETTTPTVSMCLDRYRGASCVRPARNIFCTTRCTCRLLGKQIR